MCCGSPARVSSGAGMQKLACKWCLTLETVPTAKDKPKKGWPEGWLFVPNETEDLLDESQTKPNDTRPPEEPATALIRVFRFAIVAGLGVLDLWSKAAVFEWLTQNRDQLVLDSHGHLRYPILGEWFTFMKSENRGAAWGHFESMPYLLIGGRIVAVLFLSWLVLRATKARPVFTLALMLVLAGASGNLWDNLFLEPPHDHPFGAVRDFIDVYFPVFGEDGWHFPTFNVADSCISVGAVLLLLSGVGSTEEVENVQPAAEQEPAVS